MRLSASELDERRRTLTEVLRNDGDVAERHTPRGVLPAGLDLRVRAPGGAAGHVVSFRYSETFDRGDSAADLLLVRYVFVMAWQNGLGQREFHWHPLRWSEGAPIHHEHCTGAGTTDRGHFRSHRILLEEARAIFLRAYATEEPIDCSDLFPIDGPRTRVRYDDRRP